MQAVSTILRQAQHSVPNIVMTQSIDFGKVEERGDGGRGHGLCELAQTPLLRLAVGTCRSSVGTTMVCADWLICITMGASIHLGS